MTDPALPSGSDRVHAALAAFDAGGRFDVAVNLQGDMPTMARRRRRPRGRVA